MTATCWFEGPTLQDEIDPQSAPLTPLDLGRLAAVDASLARGLAIKSWWNGNRAERPAPLDIESTQSHLAASRFQESFALMRLSQYWPHDVSYGFYDQLDQVGLRIPLMGCFQQFFYDQPTLRLRDALHRVPGLSAATIEEANDAAMQNWRDNLREFVLGTFINTTSRLRPYPVACEDASPLATYLKPFNWCPDGEGQRSGMRFSQQYYKRNDNGRVGKFWPVESARINLREIGSKYAWIVIQDEVSGFDLEFRLDDDTPYVGLPVIETQYGVISPEFIVEDEAEGNGVAARYGFGYALLEHQESEDSDGVPPPYDIGLQQTEFWLEDDGEILVQNYLIAKRPSQISVLNVDPAGLGISVFDRLSLGLFSNLLQPLAKGVRHLPLVGQFDPLLAYIRFANAVTGGFAARELCVRTEQLERRILFNHYLKQFDAVLGTRGIWRHRRDWTSSDPHRH